MWELSHPRVTEQLLIIALLNNIPKHVGCNNNKGGCFKEVYDGSLATRAFQQRDNKHYKINMSQ